MTAHHSLLIDGVLVPAEMLINGTTITRYEAREYDELEFFHIKLESHDVVYAEGVPAETLVYVDECVCQFRWLPSPVRNANYGGGSLRSVGRDWGGRAELKSRLRSALSPWIDFRDQADVVRDRLEEGGIV